MGFLNNPYLRGVIMALSIVAGTMLGYQIGDVTGVFIGAMTAIVVTTVAMSAVGGKASFADRPMPPFRIGVVVRIIAGSVGLVSIVFGVALIAWWILHVWQHGNTPSTKANVGLATPIVISLFMGGSFFIRAAWTGKNLSVVRPADDDDPGAAI